MTVGRRLRIVAACAAAIGTLAAAPAPRAERPPYAKAYEPRTVDERGQWMMADENERQLRDSPLLIRDEALNNYVRHVLCTAVGDDRCASVRIYILEMPYLNASMMANGAMRVWSGLLLRARNEAELAAVLGHEFAHFELRHTLTSFKQHRTATDIGAWVAVLGALARTNTVPTQLSVLGSTFRFDREQETAADLLAVRYLAASPYPPAAAAELLENHLLEADASAAGRKQKAGHTFTPGFFDNHPTDLSRVAYLRHASAAAEGGDRKASDYRSAIEKHLPMLLDDQLRLNDFGGTEYLLYQLSKVDGWTGQLLFARAELYRQRANPRDLVSAAQFYKEAMAAGYAAPEARRNLGLALLRGGNVAEGKAALAEYLRLQPNASDANAISALLSN